MPTPITPAEETLAPARRGWLKRLAAVLGGTLLAGPALARAARRSPTQVQGSQPFLGEIMLCAFNFPPKGFAMCNGQLLPVNQNQALFSILGTRYGGNGVTTFGLPDLRGRVPRGQGTSGATTYVAGQAAGTANATLPASAMLPHSHQANVSGAAATTNSPVGNVPAVASDTNLNGEAVTVLAYGSPAATAAGATNNAGSSAPFSPVTPFLALNYCIALQGNFPGR